MIKYHYNLETDPEPGPHVRRLSTRCPDGHPYRALRTRQPCRRKGYRRVGRRMTPSDRRWARRRDEFQVSRGGRRLHHPAHSHRFGGWSCQMATGGLGHYHWTDGDKSRGWGPMRGDTLAVDLDAFRRLHSMKRRGWK